MVIKLHYLSFFVHYYDCVHFLGTLASNLARGINLSKAVINALHCATLSVSKEGAQKSYSYLSDIDPEFRPLDPNTTDDDEFCSAKLVQLQL